MLTKGSIVQLTNPAVSPSTDPQKYLYTFVDNPLDKLVGPGYGKQGLKKVPGFYWYDTNQSVNGQTSSIPNQVRYIRFSIKKSQVPNMTLADIKEYFSRGLWLYRDADANQTVGKASWKIFGPMICHTSDDTQAADSNGYGTLVEQIYCKNGATFAHGQQVFQQYLDGNGKLLEKSSTITNIEEFAFDNGDGYYWLHLCGLPTPAGVASRAISGDEYFAAPPTVNQQYFAYDMQGDPADLGSSLDLKEHLISTCEVTVTDLAKEPLPSAFNSLPNTDTTTAPYLVHKLQQRLRVTRRATERDPVLTFSPNDFMQYFNCGFSDDKD